MSLWGARLRAVSAAIQCGACIQAGTHGAARARRQPPFSAGQCPAAARTPAVDHVPGLGHQAARQGGKSGVAGARTAKGIELARQARQRARGVSRQQAAQRAAQRVAGDEQLRRPACRLRARRQRRQTGQQQAVQAARAVGRVEASVHARRRHPLPWQQLARGTVQRRRRVGRLERKAAQQQRHVGPDVLARMRACKARGVVGA